MNRFIRFKNVKINIGELHGNDNPPKKIDYKVNNSYAKIVVTNKYFNLKNQCFVECDIEMSYGMIGTLLNISRRDLYYLNSKKETVTKEEILNRLIEENILKNIIVRNNEI